MSIFPSVSLPGYSIFLLYPCSLSLSFSFFIILLLSSERYCRCLHVIIIVRDYLHNTHLPQQYLQHRRDRRMMGRLWLSPGWITDSLKWISYIFTTQTVLQVFKCLPISSFGLLEPRASVELVALEMFSPLGMPLWTYSWCLACQDSYYILLFSPDTVLTNNVLLATLAESILTDGWMAGIGCLLVHGPFLTSPKTHNHCNYPWPTDLLCYWYIVVELIQIYSWQDYEPIEISSCSKLLWSNSLTEVLVPLP